MWWWTRAQDLERRWHFSYLLSKSLENAQRDSQRTTSVVALLCVVRTVSDVGVVCGDLAHKGISNADI